MPLGIKPTVDFAFKRIFGSPENVPVLIGLLNAILRLPSPIVHAVILNPFSYQDFASDKLSEILFRDSPVPHPFSVGGPAARPGTCGYDRGTHGGVAKV
jgi:hypothetical protein